MTYIFGEDAKGELNKAANGLFLHGVFEEQFDRHKIVIVPYRGLWNSPLGAGKTFADLHQQKLIFEPNHPFRPRARYLFFHYVMAMLQLGRGQKAEKAGMTSDMPELSTPATSRVWATQGRYLRKNMIRAFIEGIGHEDTDAETSNMLSHAMDDQPDETDRIVKTAKLMAVESDDEDDSDE
ncbi:hypothetical protein MMC07_001187 [Pseudocyphellaria aurata]|nr:hypothetical protein [Pseudocyphellaria aurata]